MAATYRFKTVMVTDSDRYEFSKIRDSFGVKISDKELFTAMFDVMDLESVKNRVLELKQKKETAKEKEKIKKLENKLKEKLNKLQSVEKKETEEKVS